MYNIHIRIWYIIYLYNNIMSYYTLYIQLKRRDNIRDDARNYVAGESFRRVLLENRTPSRYVRSTSEYGISMARGGSSRPILHYIIY